MITHFIRRSTKKQDPNNLISNIRHLEVCVKLDLVASNFPNWYERREAWGIIIIIVMIIIIITIIDLHAG